jgi:hypothetical protein
VLLFAIDDKATSRPAETPSPNAYALLLTPPACVSKGQTPPVRGTDPQHDLSVMLARLLGLGPVLSDARHYKKRCAQSKAAANGFLRNLATGTLDSNALLEAKSTKAIWIQNLSASRLPNPPEQKFF